MDASKTKYMKQNEVKVYNCTFELQLFELRIFLRFPCKFFVEWKTNIVHKYLRTEGFVENLNGKVDFKKKLTMEIQMVHDYSKNTWTRKDSTISVYLVTRNKPDFNQLVGRINIDLAAVCQNNPYQKAFTQSLTYSSTSADLKFALNMKYSLMSKKTIAEVDLHEFNEKLHLFRQSDNLNKSKSTDHIKNMQHVVSPVYQIAQSPINASPKSTEVKPFHFPVSKLQSYSHEVHQIIKQGDEKTNQIEQEFSARMTLGKDKNPLTKKQYDQIIQEQKKGMKKSDLMVVPDMKKSRVEEDDSEFKTDHSKKREEDYQQIYDMVQNFPLKKVGSESQLHKRSKSPKESDIDIVIDLSEAPQSKEKIEFNENYLKNSINSGKSFSISRFKAQFQGSGREVFAKIREPQDSITSLEMPTVLKKHVSSNDGKDDIQKIAQKYDDSRNRVKQLEADLSEFVKILTDIREKGQKLQDQKKKTFLLLQDLTFENAELQKKVDDWEQKANYESRINQINCEKLKVVSIQLTQQKIKSRSQDILPDLGHFSDQVKKLKENLKNLSFQKASLQEKLFRRDQIELQNQIRIQQLEEQLIRYRTQKLNSAPKVSPSSLQLQSKIVKSENISQNQLKQKEYIYFLEEKLQTIEKQNIKIKDMCNEAYNKIEIYSERDQRMKENILIAEKQFQTVIKLLIQRQKLLKEKIIEIEILKRKSSSSVFSPLAAQQAKYKAMEQELKKKEQMLTFCESQIQLLEEELTKMQLQNKELLELHNNHFRESIKYEGDLKVIKEEESYRESLASSGQTFRLSFASPKLNVKQENIVASYGEAVLGYYAKHNMNEKFDIEFMADIHDLRWKAFEELQRSAKIINDLLQKNEQIQIKLGEFQEQEKVSAGSSNITPGSGNISYKPGQEQITDQYSQVTRKRSPMVVINEAKLSREVQKLKSLLYDKSKEMNDLIASYEKLKLQQQTMKTKKVTIKRPSIYNGDESDTELVHDLLDLQIRLNKQKQHKSQIMSELSIQKSLNKSQQISQYAQFDISEIYKEIRSLILSRQNFITTEESLNRLVGRINELERASQRTGDETKIMYIVQEKSRSISKEIQIMKSALFKMNFKELQPYQYKTTFANILKPCQTVLNELLTSIEEMVNTFG